LKPRIEDIQRRFVDWPSDLKNSNERGCCTFHYPHHHDRWNFSRKTTTGCGDPSLLKGEYGGKLGWVGIHKTRNVRINQGKQNLGEKRKLKIFVVT